MNGKPQDEESFMETALNAALQVSTDYRARVAEVERKAEWQAGVYQGLMNAAFDQRDKAESRVATLEALCTEGGAWWQSGPGTYIDGYADELFKRFEAAGRGEEVPQ